jgi:hypothetical protein
MLQIHAPSLVLARNMRNINRDKNISLLILKANKREQDRHKIRLIGAALLFGARRRGSQEVVNGCVGTVPVSVSKKFPAGSREKEMNIS